MGRRSLRLRSLISIIQWWFSVSLRLGIGFLGQVQMGHHSLQSFPFFTQRVLQLSHYLHLYPACKKEVCQNVNKQLKGNLKTCKNSYLAWAVLLSSRTCSWPTCLRKATKSVKLESHPGHWQTPCWNKGCWCTGEVVAGASWLSFPRNRTSSLSPNLPVNEEE